MDLSDIRNYVDRDWRAAEREQQKAFEADGAEQALSRVDAARRFLGALCPDWPGERTRAEDFEHHVRLAALLRRAER